MVTSYNSHFQINFDANFSPIVWKENQSEEQYVQYATFCV